MKKDFGFTMIAFAAFLFIGSSARTSAVSCSSTGFQDLTAAHINPGDINGGTYDGTGCDIAIYYGAGADNSVKNAVIYGAKRFGVLVNGDSGVAAVDVVDSQISDIGDTPSFTGNQYGVAIYYRAYFATGSATGRVSGNHISRYQKAGVVVNGQGASVQVQDNTIEGLGPLGFIAQNGIQFGWGSSGSAMKNTISRNQYTGNSTFSGGIIVVGGPGWSAVYGGPAPDGNPWPYTIGIQIVKNTLTNNDVGVASENYDTGFAAAGEATNIKVVNNTISSEAFTSGIYQAGVADVGNNDKIITNAISGAGYDPTTVPGSTFAVDADVSFTNRPKVHANK